MTNGGGQVSNTFEDDEDMSWVKSFDAQVWTRKWLETVARSPGVPTSESTMHGWFCDALLAGYDHARREVRP